MPAPAFLSRLPKPVLFGLYGALGGLIGALAFGELIMFALEPSNPPPPPPPEPRLAIGASDKIQIYQGGTNKLLVQIARDGFKDDEGDVTVRVEGLPPEVTPTSREVVIPANKTAGEVELKATFATVAGTEHKLKVIATAKSGGKVGTAEAACNLTPLASPMPQADIVFVLDVTGSMQRQIDGLKDGIGTFANDLERAKVDARFGCLTFRDLDEGEPSETLMFGGSQFTADATVFSREVARLRAGGGGASLPESSLEAIVDATKYEFRKGATRTLILITDAAPKIRQQGTSVKATAEALTDKKIDLLHLVIDPPGRNEYRAVQLGALGIPGEKVVDRGKEFSLDRTARDTATFTNVLLPEMTRAIVAAAEAKPAARPELAKQEVVQPKRVP